MAAKTPVKATFTGSDVTGLAEFVSGDFVDYTIGGTGLTSLGSAGQVLKVNSGATALEFGNVEAVLNIDGMTDGSGITIVDADKFAISDGGTEKYIEASQITSYVQSGITALDATSIADGSVSNTELQQYALRALGKPVIEINADDDQLEDRIDEALQYFAQYHYDGIRRTYLKYQYTQADYNRINADTSESVTKNSVTTTRKEGNAFIVVPESVISVINIFPYSNKGNLNLFDVRYQLRLNDLYDFSSTSIINYDVVLRHLDFLDHILVGEKPLRFNQHDNRLYIDQDWKNDLQVGEYLVIECYRKLDPTVYTDVYNDIYLKRYVTALFKKQWGANLSKFNGVTMLGGVSLNGQQIFSEALQDIQKLEEEIRSTFELNPAMMIG